MKNKITEDKLKNHQVEWIVSLNNGKLIDFFEDLLWQATNGSYGVGLDWEQARIVAENRVKDFLNEFKLLQRGMSGIPTHHKGTKIMKNYNKKLVKWAKNHYWDSLEKDKYLILKHLLSFNSDNIECKKPIKFLQRVVKVLREDVGFTEDNARAIQEEFGDLGEPYETLKIIEDYLKSIDGINY